MDSLDLTANGRAVLASGVFWGGITVKTLETERLLLREWRLADSPDMFEYACSDLVGPRAGWNPHKDEAESKAIIQMFIDAGDVYAIVLKSEDKVIGSVGLHKTSPDKRSAHLKQKEVGFVLNPKYWGNGYVPEAVQRVIQYGFEEEGLDLIWCAHADTNLNSQRVTEKSGFKFQFSRLEVRERLGNEQVNSRYYNIAREDYFGAL